MGAALVVLAVVLMVSGATGLFEVGVRADETGTAGSIEPGSVLLLAAGAVAGIAGSIALFREYERWLPSRGGGVPADHPAQSAVGGVAADGPRASHPEQMP